MRLFRYFDAKGGLLTLKDRRFRLADPRNFNDPFELTPRVEPAADDLIVEKLSSEEWIRDFFENSGKVKGFDEAQSREEYLTKELPRRIEQAIATKDERAKEARFEMLEACAKQFRMLCFTLNHESILMWSHYAEKHYGMVIEIETDQLKRDSDLSSGVFDVRYRTSPPLMRALERDEQVASSQMIEVMRTKAICWSYEEEMRMLLPLQVERKPAEQLYLSFDPLCIKRVIVGCYDHPDEHTYKMIDDMADQVDYKHVRFQRAYIHPHDYKLSFADRPARTHP